MTQKDKLREAFMTLLSIKMTASTIDSECKEYSSTAASYARAIMQKCDACLNKLR